MYIVKSFICNAINSRQQNEALQIINKENTAHHKVNTTDKTYQYRNTQIDTL